MGSARRPKADLKRVKSWRPPGRQDLTRKEAEGRLIGGRRPTYNRPKARSPPLGPRLAIYVKNLNGHNLTHMARQKMPSTPKDAEFRRGSFWFPPNHLIFRAPGRGLPSPSPRTEDGPDLVKRVQARAQTSAFGFLVDQILAAWRPPGFDPLTVGLRPPCVGRLLGRLIWLGCLACFALARLSWSCLARAPAS